MSRCDVAFYGFTKLLWTFPYKVAI